MKLLELIQTLDKKSNQQRLHLVCQWLDTWQINYRLQDYATGTNLFVEADRRPFIGIGSHFDVVPGSGGANDNGSAIAVTLELLRRSRHTPTRHIGLQFFFFDQEEQGLEGSKAYIQQYGIKDMIGLFNLEMVGMGDRFALWSVNEQSEGRLLEVFEQQCSLMQVPALRFDRIVTHYADHVSFREAGVMDAFSITRISAKDVEVAQQYYWAQAAGADMAILKSITTTAPLFRHYHQPSDLSEHLDEASLKATAAVLWQAILAIDEKWPE